MPRTARASAGGVCYHVINRGNGGATVFHGSDEYQAFVALLGEERAPVAMRILAYCLMPNHFHLVLWPFQDGDLSRWMQWLMTAHVRRHHQRHGSSGHVWQGRFKAFPVQHDEHLVSVLRYVERNPLRAGLVERAENWAWSSLRLRLKGRRSAVLADSPVPLRNDWPAFVGAPQTVAELERLRHSVNRGTPFGDDGWVRETATRLGLESSLRPRGRPKQDRGGADRKDLS